MDSSGMRTLEVIAVFYAVLSLLFMFFGSEGFEVVYLFTFLLSFGVTTHLLLAAKGGE